MWTKDIGPYLRDLGLWGWGLISASVGVIGTFEWFWPALSVGGWIVGLGCFIAGTFMAYHTQCEKVRSMAPHASEREKLISELESIGRALDRIAVPDSLDSTAIKNRVLSSVTLLQDSFVRVIRKGREMGLVVEELPSVEGDDQTLKEWEAISTWAESKWNTPRLGMVASVSAVQTGDGIPGYVLDYTTKEAIPRVKIHARALVDAASVHAILPEPKPRGRPRIITA